MTRRHTKRGCAAERRTANEHGLALLRDQRGGVSLEYVVTVAVGITVATALGVLGVYIGLSAEHARAVLSSESP